MKHWETDICVIGGGPAGACIATDLARRGHRVSVVEAARFPRPHIGESLTPGILPLLERLGLRDEVERAGFLRPRGAWVAWCGSPELREDSGAEPGLQVDRGKFDQLLLDAALAAGAQVVSPARAATPTRVDQGWSVPLQLPTQRGTLSARYVVFANGRRPLWRRRRQRISAPTLAIYGYWRNSGLDGHESRIEALDDSWLWAAPLPGGTTNVAWFVDPDSDRIAGRAGIERAYTDALRRSTLLNSCADGQRDTELRSCDASSYVSDTTVGDAWISIGDAALTIDPLSSQGVQLAVKTAAAAASVVHTVLCRPQQAAVAMAFYRSRIAESRVSHQTIAGRFYAEQRARRATAFWTRRAVEPSANRASAAPPVPQPSPSPHTRPLSADTPLRLAAATRIVASAVLSGEFIEQRQAVQHPSLERPVAYLQDLEMVPLLRCLEGAATVGMLLEVWTARIGSVSSRRLLGWLLEKGLVEPLA